MKQFELIVKQEITNHNDQILSTNMTIEKLKKEVDNFPRKIEASNNALRSDIKFLHDIVRSVEDEREEFKRNIRNLIHELERSFSKESERLGSMISELAESMSLCSLDNEKLKKICLDHVLLEKETRNNFATINHHIIRSENRSSDALRLFKKEIDEKPCKSTMIKDDLLALIQAHRLEASEVLKEVRIVKHDCLYIDKKIEALFTLIDKANKKIDEVACHRLE